MRKRAVFPTLLALALAVLASERVARAGDPPAADALFRQAQDLVVRGEVGRACAMLAESQRLDPAVGTLLNWGDCEERAGHVARAHQLFVQAKELLPVADDRVVYATTRMASLAPRVPHLTLRRAPGVTELLRVRSGPIDYSEASMGVPLPIDPGPHHYLVDAPGREPAAFSVTIGEGESLTLEIRPGGALHAPQPGTPTPPVAPPRATSQRTFGWILSGLGVAALGTGVVTGLLVVADASTYKTHCTPGCDDEGIRAGQAGKPLGIVSPVALGVGALAAGLGAYLLLTPTKTTALAVFPGGVGLGQTF